MLRRFLAVLLLIAFIIAAVFLFNLFLFIKTPSGDVAQSVVIERGTPLSRILKTLEDQGVVSNRHFFKVYIVAKRAGDRIRAGDYSFPARISPGAVLDLLLKGDFARRRVTIPEGWTAREIAKYLGEMKLVDPTLFIAKCSDPAFIRSLGLDVPHLEGYLFPDTYEIYQPKSEEDVLKKFVGHFLGIYTPEFEARAQQIGFTRQQVLTLASIVEKETASREEKPIVAGVFFNRLKKGMPLASDPTVIYGVSGFNGNLTRADLQRPGPYNTYLNPGLPPTPIANPGLGSIRAVLYPAETEYLFFVSKNDGTHYFSKTAEEHGSAVRQYQSNRRRQPEEVSPQTPTAP